MFFEVHAQVEADTLRGSEKPRVLLAGDSTALQKNAGGTASRAFAVDTLYRSPWGAVARSLVFPGWGQWYNDSKWKAPVFLFADASMMSIYMVKNKKVSRIEHQRKQIDRQIRTDPFLTNEQRQILNGRYNNLTTRLDGALNDRNLYGWLFAISHLLGMVDSYVDAHLFNFNEKMDIAYDPSVRAVVLTWRIQR